MKIGIKQKGKGNILQNKNRIQPQRTVSATYTRKFAAEKTLK